MAIVQAAIVLPVVLTFIFGIFEFSRYVMLLQLATNAVREGCRYAVTHTQAIVLSGVTYNNNTTDVTTKVTTMLGGQSLASQSVSVYTSDSSGTNLGSTWQNTQAGQYVTVKITGNFTSLLATFLHMPATLAISATSTMEAESN